ncbi:MAG: carboxypeptidase-like regulatory domain-containing protein [Bacteroidales bacterium]|nr:carboxypeptidase-like regulatory domain-containing protein [Bacteroidales bacterium]
MKALRRYSFVLLLLGCVFAPVLLVAQGGLTKLRGVVIDSITSEPVMFANVAFVGTTQGTITSELGEFFIETRTPGDALQISFVGYETVRLPITPGVYRELRIALIPSAVTLDAVVVKAGEPYANRIMRQVFSRKKQNNHLSRSYSCTIYNKMEVDINNVGAALRENYLLKNFGFVWDYVDTNAVTGKSFLPFYISETVSDFHYRNTTPEFKREVVRASKVAGIKNSSVSQFTGAFYLDVNIYDNHIKIFNQNLVSPLSSMGLLYYNYALLDSAMINNRKCYQISFKPRRVMEPAFVGDMWINDTTFAVVKAQARLANNVNINYVKALVASMEFAPLNDTVWFPSMVSIFVDFNMIDKATGCFGHKTTTYSNVDIAPELSPEIVELPDIVTVTDTALQQSDAFWQQARPFELTERESNIYNMVDSVQRVPIYRTYVDLVDMFFVNYYYTVGYVSFGPYYRLYSFNDLEGHRFELSARTSNRFSTNMRISAFAAYGTGDKRFKYGGEFFYIFKHRPRLSASLSYRLDVEHLGGEQYMLASGNFFASILSRTPQNKLMLVESARARLFKEWILSGMQTTLTMAQQRFMPSPFIAFERTDGLGALGQVTAASATLSLRWKFKERIVSGVFNRVSLGSAWPEMVLTATGGLARASQRYPYLDLRLRFIHRLKLKLLGHSRIMAECGQIFGAVPYPLLRLHEGNETYAFERNAFNMMNHYEFASDRYAQLSVEHHFQGLFLNRIPLLRMLKLREVFTFKTVVGTLSEQNRQILLFPEGMQSLGKPYAEVGVGLENILKLLRVDAFWRLTHLNHPNIQKFGLRVCMQFEL